jgi:GTP cyclohydrolase II
MQNLSPVYDLASTKIPTRWGNAQLNVFDSQPGGEGEIVTLVHRPPEVDAAMAPLVRLHSVCLTGDVLGSLVCDCGPQLQTSLTQIMNTEYGILMYILNHEGRGIGLANKIRAMELQLGGVNTVDANTALDLPVDARDYLPCASVLRHLQVSRVRLMTNNPEKVRSLQEVGIDVVERVPVSGFENQFNRDYLATKKVLLGHLI